MEFSGSRICWKSTGAESALALATGALIANKLGSLPKVLSKGRNGQAKASQAYWPLCSRPPAALRQTPPVTAFDGAVPRFANREWPHRTLAFDARSEAPFARKSLTQAGATGHESYILGQFALVCRRDDGLLVPG